MKALHWCNENTPTIIY